MNRRLDHATASQRVRRFKSVEALVNDLGLDFARRIDTALAERGRALIALSGGRTPEPLYDRLGLALIPWGGVTCVLVDERLVPPWSPDSNSHLIGQSLFAGPAAISQLDTLWIPFCDPADAALAADRRLRAHAAPFDLVLLGMGEDGHMASLFPWAPELVEGLDPASCRYCMPVAARDPAPVQPRLTLTLAAILNARQIILMITGRRKLDTLEQALAGKDARDMPIRAVLLQTKTPVDIVWAPEP